MSPAAGFTTRRSMFFSIVVTMSILGPTDSTTRSEAEVGTGSHTTPSRSLEGAGSVRSLQIAQFFLLAFLYAGAALVCLHSGNTWDPDVWWHLRTGEWIAQHHAVPYTDPFSSYGMGKHLEAYSWLFELIVFLLFQKFGLAGIVIYTSVMVATITFTFHRTMQRLQPDFSVAVAITIAAFFCFGRIYTPRPWLLTILFYILEVKILLQARRTGKNRQLLWLLLVFVLWANIHIQWVDGLVVLGIAVIDSLLSPRWPALSKPIPATWTCGIFLASILATLVNPYGWRIYQVAFDYATDSTILNKLQELQAMSFRDAGDWVVLLLVLGAVFVLARARSQSLFEILLLAFSIYTSFRSTRDVWIAVTASCAILATHLHGDEKNRALLTPAFTPLIACASAVLLLIGSWILRVNNDRLSAGLSEHLPVRAVEFVKQRNLTGPLYNDYGWGGYLMWTLRIPTSIDGRTNVHGDQRVNRSDATWNALPDWAADPDLTKAHLVIGPVQAPLNQVLRLDPSFHLVYEDKIAAVFTADGGAAKTY